MPIIRLLVLALTILMTVVTLVVLVTLALGVGWIAVSIPVLAILGLIGIGHALWRRWGASPDEPEE